MQYSIAHESCACRRRLFATQHVTGALHFDCLPRLRLDHPGYNAVHPASATLYAAMMPANHAATPPCASRCSAPQVRALSTRACTTEAERPMHHRATAKAPGVAAAHEPRSRRRVPRVHCNEPFAPHSVRRRGVPRDMCAPTVCSRRYLSMPQNALAHHWWTTPSSTIVWRELPWPPHS